MMIYDDDDDTTHTASGDGHDVGKVMDGFVVRSREGIISLLFHFQIIL